MFVRDWHLPFHRVMDQRNALQDLLDSYPPEDREFVLSQREADFLEAPAPQIADFPRPHGVKDLILATVAESASRRFGKPVSKRSVREAWANYRRKPTSV